MKVSLLLALVLFPLATSCGSSGGGQEPPKPACGAGSTCGGDLTGTWTSRVSCISVTGTIDLGGCDASFESEPEIRITNAVYGADGKFSQNTSLKAKANLDVPAACLQAARVTTCAELQPLLQVLVPTTCATASDGGCACTVDLATGTSGAGTYSTQSGVLTLQEDDATDRSDYCVRDGQLVLVPHADSSMFSRVGIKAATVEGSIVLTK